MELSRAGGRGSLTSDNLLATTAPAEPAPTTMKSYSPYPYGSSRVWRLMYCTPSNIKFTVPSNSGGYSVAASSSVPRVAITRSTATRFHISVRIRSVDIEEETSLSITNSVGRWWVGTEFVYFKIVVTRSRRRNVLAFDYFTWRFSGTV